MKPPFFLSLWMMATAVGHAQTERFDIATFIPPHGWERMDTLGTRSYFHSKTNNGLTSFCQIILYASGRSSGSATGDFKTAWQNLVAILAKPNAMPVTQTEITPDGWTVVTGAANITNQGITYKSIVASISGFGRTMNIQVNTAGGDYTAVIEEFFNQLDMDKDATIANIHRPSENYGKPYTTTMMNKALSINDYEFVAPEKWQLQNNQDHLSIQSMESGCLIRILEPQPGSGDLEKDAVTVFDMMYAGWEYQNNGENQYTLSKGFLPKGLEYCMVEASMRTTGNEGPYHTEDGAALMVKAGSQIIVISVRHTSLVAHIEDCVNRYQTWRRFFNSFSVKNVPITKNADEETSKRIVGSWELMTNGAASGEYIFAANSNYQYIGALGVSGTSSDHYYKYMHTTTYAFQGDGSYSIAGDQLTLKNRKLNSDEQIRFRFEKVNHSGAGWKDRLWMLTEGSFGEAEACYERKEG